jgi:hypothetical protein
VNAGSKGLGSVVIIQNGDLHISGTMDGRVTFVAQHGASSDPVRVSSSSYSTGSTSYDCYNANGSRHVNGNIIVEGNLLYAHLPNDLNDNRDLLELVADNSIMLATQTAQNLTIDGSLLLGRGVSFTRPIAADTQWERLIILGLFARTFAVRLEFLEPARPDTRRTMFMTNSFK